MLFCEVLRYAYAYKHNIHVSMRVHRAVLSYLNALCIKRIVFHNVQMKNTKQLIDDHRTVRLHPLRLQHVREFYVCMHVCESSMYVCMCVCSSVCRKERFVDVYTKDTC